MALREFEAVAPGRNKAVILGKPRALRFVKSKGVTFLSIWQARKLVRSDECSAVIFHSLCPSFRPVLQSMPQNKTAIWLGWGYDYYNSLLSRAYPEGLYLEATKSLLELAPKPNSLRRLARYTKKAAKQILGQFVSSRPELLERIDYFSPVIEKEYQIAFELNPWFKARYICWNYGTVEDDFSVGLGDEVGPGKDILVGNSATPENNHLEIFEALDRDYDTYGRKIIAPLSYGDIWYRDQVIRHGHRLFGDRFVPLTGFLPNEEYIRLLDACGHVFMNHLRQQALGNICIMMLKGAKIYLNVANPLYGWFLEKGASIDAVGRGSMALGTKSLVLEPLSEPQRKTNADMVKEHWGREPQRSKTRHLVDVALGSR